MKKIYESGKGICHIPKKLLLVMKLTAFLFLVFTMQVTATVYSQNKKLSLNMQGSSIKEVLQQIEAQSEYRFIYENEKVNLDTKVSIRVTDEVVDNILKQLFEKDGINYSITNNNLILINPSDKQMKDLGKEFMNSQQQKSVSGKVTDSSGASLPGVSVVVKGTTTGVITDMDGKYTLAKVPENATLQFSFVGMKSQELAVGSQTTINVVLADETIGIEEVVAVGYGTQKKVSLTSAISTVDGESIKAKSGSDVRRLLQGELAGLTITDKGGAPGKSSIGLNIRGITTLGNNSPLVIVDGIEQDLSDINPQDIETISVLKDASSTSIYGSRAANGVILINTKRANEGRLRVSYSGYYALQKSNNNPVHMDTEDYMRMQNVAWTNSSGKPIYTEEYIQEYVNATDHFKYPLPNTWFDAMIKVAPQYSHTLSLTGGSETIKSYVSVRYMDQKGIIANYNSGMTEVRFNNDYKVSKKLNVSTDFNFRQKEILTPINESSVINRMLQTSQWTVPKYPDGTYGISSDGHNPLLYAEKGGTSKTINSYLTGSLNIEWELLEGLKFKSQLAARLIYGRSVNYQNNYEVRDYNNKGIIKKSQLLNSLWDRRDYQQEFTMNNLLDYSKIINSHTINILLGYSQISNKGNNLGGYRQNFYTNEIQSLSAGADDATKNNSGSEYMWGLRSYFGRLNYGYKDKYLFEVNSRYDGSSRFYGDNKYSFFPSLSAGWRVSKENFWAGIIDQINEFKLRGSYGTTGNQAIGLYSYFETLSKGKYSFNNTLTEAYRQTALANTDIQWETTTQLDIGVDLQALANRISLSADYYKKRTDGILLTLPVPGTLGLLPSIQNAGIIDNMGWEFILGSKNKFGDFGMNVKAYLTTNKNVVVNLAGTGPYIGGDSEIRTITGEGYPYLGFWGYKTDGLFQTKEDVLNYPTLQSGTGMGDVKYLDLNNDKLINGKDMTYLGGSFFPKYTFGTDLNLSYKNLSLNLLFQGTAGTKRYIGGAIMQMGIWGGFTHEIFTDNYWTQENPEARFPRPLKYSVRNTQLSDRNIQDGSYLRLKNAQLMYQIPSHITKRGGIESMNIYVSGTNLLTFSKLNEWDVDPESDNRDSESIYPQTSVYSIGVNINF